MSKSTKRQYSANTIRKFNRFLQNSVQAEIPNVFKDAINFLKKDRNLKIKGILCERAPIHRINKVREIIRNGRRPKYKNAHVAADILKHYLHKLQPPLFTYKFNTRIETQFLSILNTLFNARYMPRREHPRMELLIDAKLTYEGCAFLAHMTKCLPILNRFNLRLLIKYLAAVNEEPQNGMNARKLAIIFAPLIIKEHPGCALSKEFEDERVIVVKSLIENCDQFWL